MMTRALRDSDISVLERLGAETKYPYPDLRGSHIEAAQVVDDEQGRVIAAAAAKRITELYLWSDPNYHPATRLNALRLLHGAMATELRKLGYNESNIFVPPEIENSFGRRLIKSFDWAWNWRSLFLKF